MKPLTSILFASTVLVLAIPTVVEAQLTWRVSVKVVLDENGMRAVDGVTFPGCCDLNTDAEIIAMIDRANAILVGNGPADVPRTEPRGYTFDLVDIINLDDLPAPPDNVRACSNDPRRYCADANGCRTCVGGNNDGAFCDDDNPCDGGTCSVIASCDHVVHWFYAPIKAQVRDTLITVATVDDESKVLYGWNDDAINIYILGSDGSGTSWWDVAPLLGQDLAAPNTPFHEIGHFFSLYHTHGGDGASPDCVNGHDDGVLDTLWDNCRGNCGHGCDNCWCRDEIANWNFPTQCGGPCDYGDLTTQNQHRVDQAFYNLMCYRGRREVLTSGQLDRMTDYSNGAAYHVTNGRTRFVDLNATGPESGSSGAPFRTVGAGLSGADPGDIALIRQGTYDEVMTIDQYITLRASRGDVLIGGPP